MYRAGFVVGEVRAGGVANQEEQFSNVTIIPRWKSGRSSSIGGGDEWARGLVPGNSREFGGNLARRQSKVDTSGGNRARRHTGIFGGCLILGKTNASLRLDSLQSEGPIGSGSGKNHANRRIFAVFRERLKKIVDGHVLFARGRTLHQL